MTEEKKHKYLIRFHSANKIDNYNSGGRERKKKRERNIQKNLQNKSKYTNTIMYSLKIKLKKKRIINVFLESLLSEPFPSLGHNPPCLPRMPSNTVLISGPAVLAAQILIWSYSCVFFFFFLI